MIATVFMSTCHIVDVTVMQALDMSTCITDLFGTGKASIRAIHGTLYDS
jgi:hypothetical protein